MNRRAWIAMAGLLVMAPPPAARAQAVPDGRVGVDETTPFQCWWRSDAGAIRLGEVVEVVLTCAVLERADLRVVPDESRLTVAAIQMAPFEIVGGGHPPDLQADGRRLFEYRYRLRIVDADVIGRDVKLPPLSIPYRIESRVGGGTLAGRDLVHLMPQLVFRVVSQVPADATDIRDAGDAGLERIDALRFRASAFRVAALVLSLLALVVLASTVPAVLARLRGGRARSADRLSESAVLRAAAQRLGAVLEAHRDGALDADALAGAHQAVRLVAALAAGLGVRHTAIDAAAAVEGRLVVHSGWRRAASAVTASATAAAVARVLEAMPAAASAHQRARLEGLRDALTLLTKAQYGAEAAVDPVEVTDALRRTRDGALELARERRWTLGRHVAPAAVLHPRGL